MQTVNREAALAIANEISFIQMETGRRHCPMTQHDFDETNGVGKCVKRCDINVFTQPDDQPVFGIYLGTVNGKHSILLRNAKEEVQQRIAVVIMGGELFDTLDELKQRWELD